MIQVMALREQLRGLLKQIVVHPKMVDTPDLAHGVLAFSPFSVIKNSVSHI